MAELDVGKHCSLEDCKQLDFLPFLCDGCGRTFCKEHQVKDRHECDRNLLTPAAEKSPSPYQTYMCSLTGCNKSELVPVPCDKCHSNYCMLHRHAADHRCESAVPKSKYMNATAQHVKDILDSKSAAAQKRCRVPKSKKAMEMAAKVALMKLKSTAVGDLGVPAESRVYLNIQLPSNTLPHKHAAYWMDQEWSIGRTVDFVSSKSHVRNDNNKGNCPKLRLRSTTDSSLVYEMEAKLRELISNEDLYSGSSVELCYIPDEIP